MPGSLDRVRPAYHPDIFGNPALASEFGELCGILGDEAIRRRGLPARR
jgi:hypothetical protein